MSTFNWNGLPLQFKVDVASLLDFESRLCLQLCSKTNQAIVARCPVRLQKLTINHIVSKPLKYTLKSTISAGKKRQSLQKTFDSEEGVVEEFLKIFKNRKTFVEKLRFKTVHVLGKLFKDLTLRIKNEKEENGYNTKIRVKDVFWDGSFQNVYLWLIELLAYFDTSVLWSIKISSFQMTKDFVDKLIATEQFKSARKVSITPFIRIPIEKFFHLHIVKIMMQRIVPEDAVEMIKNFQTNSIPDKNYFTLRAGSNIDLQFKTIVFDLLGLPKTEQSRRSLSEDEENHVLSFPCQNKNSLFLLKIDKHSVFGVIAANEFVNKLKMDIAIFMNLLEYGFDWEDC